jgi:hypothetical protein
MTAYAVRGSISTPLIPSTTSSTTKRKRALRDLRRRRSRRPPRTRRSDPRPLRWQVTGVLDARKTNKKEVGALMSARIRGICTMDNTEKKKKEPLIRIVKRDDLSFEKPWFASSASFPARSSPASFSFGIIGQKDPFPAVGIIFEGTFKSGNFKKFRSPPSSHRHAS